MKASRRAVVTDISPSVFKDKTVLVRVDYNVPVAAVNDVMTTGKITSSTKHHHTWVVTNDAKIRASLPTIRYLTGAGAKVVICSHMGRPPREAPAGAKGQQSQFSLHCVLYKLSNYLEDHKLSFASDCIGKDREEKMSQLKGGEVLVLENTRFHPLEEENNDPAFALALADGIDIFVMDAFASSHRAHASVAGVRPVLPPLPGVGQGLGLLGLHAKEEIIGLDRCIMNPARPVMAIIGGAKMSTKLPVIKALLKSCALDYLVVGGAMAHTFLAANGVSVGKSLCEDSVEMQQLARDIMSECAQSKVELILPSDFVLGTGESAGGKTGPELVAAAKAADGEKVVTEVPAGGIVQDVGPATVSAIVTAMQKCRTIFFNGPLGHWEVQPFDSSTNAVIDWLSARGTDVISVVCGGDTVAAVEAHLHIPEKHSLTISQGRQGISPAAAAASSRLPHDTAASAAFTCSHFSHLSLAGGAALEYLEKRRMPGLEGVVFLAELPDSVLTDAAKNEKRAGSEDYSSGQYRDSQERLSQPDSQCVSSKLE